ncbi:uncharacterized protein [Bactrocera oleae]|uniref:uncharacterized protein n=1 Tax=Bactrocera oleae TaxID=104688 RepID=UPI00387EAF3C
MKLEKKLKKNAVPDIHLPNVSEPSFEEVFSPNSIIELGNEDFLPVVAESPDISNNLMLLASVVKEAQEEIGLFDRMHCKDIGIQTNLNLISGAFREQKLVEENFELKNKLEEKEREISYLKFQLQDSARKYKRLQNELKEKEESFDVIGHFCSNFPPQISAIVQNNVKNFNRNPNGRRYDNYFKTLALGVYFLSPLAYRHLKPILRIPDERTLDEFVSEWPRDSGCNSSSIRCLELKSRGFSQEQKFVSILCDEMALKSHMQYLPKFDKIVGVEDYGAENRTSRIGNSAMTLMVQGIGGAPWSHPLSYFIVHGSCKGDVAKKYIFETITQLQNIGLNPCHFVCDQGSNFLNLARVLGVSEEHPFFEVNGKDIFFSMTVPTF